MGSQNVMHGLLTTLFAMILGVAIYIFASRGGKGWWRPCDGGGGYYDDRDYLYRERHQRRRPQYIASDPPFYEMGEGAEEAYEPSLSTTTTVAAVDPPLPLPVATSPPFDPCVVPPPPPPPHLDLQAIIDFSDALVTPEQREEVLAVAEDAKQIQSVNERFDDAKRKVTENRLRPGVYTNKERHKLVDNLLRRPYCSRRVRSWRTENSDTLRGDVIPKRTSSWGMLRAGRSNPEIDLHPGSMGLMSGLEGKWLSEEIIPDNAVNDPL
jgi:hypothetical protein